MTKNLPVEIYGQSYTIHGDLDPAYVKQLARLVDAKMQALQRQTDTLDTRRLAVLAALNLADELEQLKEKLTAERVALPHQFSRRLEECNRLLESALNPPPGA